MSVRLNLAMRVLVAGCVLALVGCDQDGFCLECEEGAVTASDAAIDSGDFGFNADGSVNDRDATVRVDGSVPKPCTPRADGMELCNELDDDCNGTVDEGFDLSKNPEHCGACNTPCVAENAEASCEDGVCVPGACLDGFADHDGNTGCEYRCPVFPARAEDCNGQDDDCDGVVDEELPAPPGNLCNTRAGTPCAGTVATCETVGAVTTWFCQYDAAVDFDPSVPNGIAIEETRCDGVDEDCDALADDPWPNVGDPCDDSGIGVCRDQGVVACDTVTETGVTCDLSVLPDPVASSNEVCNGVDDDCDGDLDEDVVDDMVHVTTGGNFYIFRYEASHPDATATAQGLSTGRACSNPNVLPWTFVTYEQADAACTAAGKRLCTASEWSAACGATAYPYGATYDGAACNGADHTAQSLVPTGSMASCDTTGGVFDMSGNAKEWTTQSPVANTYVVRGGSYLSPELGLTCQTTLSQAAATPGQAGIGFRCCSNTAP